MEPQNISNQPPDMEYKRWVVRQMLHCLGDDPRREGLQETPRRVAEAWDEWFAGYKQDASAMLKTFTEDAAGGGDEMVIVRDIDMFSHCEHHLAPFFGKAHIGYIPRGRVVGLSKLPRVLEVFARRLQMQERITNQVADLIDEVLKPKGVGVVIEATHFCVCSRGVNKQGSTTITSALRGAMMEKPEARAEFMGLIRR